MKMKTLIFCTGYSKNLEEWEMRYGRWINAVESGNLNVDTILIPDDGSKELPDWEGVTILKEDLPDQEPDSRGIIYSFPDNLGRKDVYVTPGWHRSFMFAMTYAQKYGYEKVIHLESDAFIISPRMEDYINEISNGWETFWCPKWRLPETSIQVIAGNSLNDYLELSLIPYEKFSGKPPDPNPSQGESWLRFTHIHKEFKGDRYGENGANSIIPEDADYACQILPHTFCWWLEK
jgi:hypothetical protein